MVRRGAVGPPERLYLADPAEGTVEPLTLDLAEDQQFDPCWSADGSWLAYAVDEGVPRDEFYLRRVDLETRRVTRLEGSEGLSSPKCAGTGASWRATCSRSRRTSRLGTASSRGASSSSPRPGDRPLGPADRRPAPGAAALGGENLPGEIAYPTWSHDSRHVTRSQARSAGSSVSN